MQFLQSFLQQLVTGYETWGCTTMNMQANIEAWSGNTHHCPGSRNSGVCLCQQSDVDAILGL